jgi:peptidoglycan hydrolase-like protein with peptidoglycan-binding domain
MKPTPLLHLIAASVLLTACQANPPASSQATPASAPTTETARPQTAPTAPPAPQEAAPSRPAAESQPATSDAKAEVAMSVAEMQRKLKELGYDPGPADGVAGKKTVDALKRFQRANHLPATGVLDAETTRRLHSAKR